MRLYTIGYEGLNVTSFLASLKEYQIQTIVDVRLMPISRKPGFSKTKLHEFLKEINIEYTHFQALGCPQYIRNAYKENKDWKSYCQHFLKYLSHQDGSLEELRCLADESSCALLCFEADHRFCHRSLIAEAVYKKTGMLAGHIIN